MAGPLRTFAAPVHPERSLLCFPHAGGTAGSYRDWARFLPPSCGLQAVQYAGRQDRRRDPQPATLREVAAEIAALLPAAPDGTVLFGHSFGAAVAFEVVRYLERQGRPPVRQLIVSGRPGPGRHRRTSHHLLDDDALWDTMLALGGTAPELADVPELKSLVLPSLRGDYRRIETYSPDPHPLMVDLTAYRGTHDPEVSQDDLLAWSSATSGRFRFREFPGAHFYLADQPAAVIAAILTDSDDSTHPDSETRNEL